MHERAPLPTSSAAEPGLGLAATVVSPPPAAPPVDAELVGSEAAGLRFEEVIGSGGMATVYRATHLASGQSFAVKVLRPELARHAEVVARFRGEAAIANLVESSHVVRALEHGDLPSGQPYIVLELLEGETLFQLLQRGPPELSQAREILLQICEALEHAHGRGVVHRDLKPENIFLVATRSGTPFVKLMDFGVAKAIDAPGVTRQGVVMGTPHYMAPEQVEGERLDGRADLYSLAVIAYELTTGHKPFPGQSALQQMVARLSLVPPPPQSLAGHLPEAWNAVVLRGLARRAEDRFPTAAALAEAIRAALPRAGVSTPRRQSVRHLVDLTARLKLGPGAIGATRVCELAAGGARVLVEASLQVGQAVELAIDVLGPDAWIPCAVVRTTPESAALQFQQLPEALRTPLSTFLQRACRTTTGGRPVALLRFAGATEGSLYQLLGAPLDASYEALVNGARALENDLAAASESADPRDVEELARANRLWSELSHATRSDEDRLAYDIRIGNWRGVAVALRSGLPASKREALRESYLRSRVGLEIQVSLYLGRATLAESWGDLAAAIRELETALSLDPLRGDLHERREALALRASGG